MPPRCPRCGGWLICENGFGWFREKCCDCGYAKEGSVAVIASAPESANEKEQGK